MKWSTHQSQRKHTGSSQEVEILAIASISYIWKRTSLVLSTLIDRRNPTPQQASQTMRPLRKNPLWQAIRTMPIWDKPAQPILSPFPRKPLISFSVCGGGICRIAFTLSLSTSLSTWMPSLLMMKARSFPFRAPKMHFLGFNLSWYFSSRSNSLPKLMSCSRCVIWRSYHLYRLIILFPSCRERAPSLPFLTAVIPTPADSNGMSNLQRAYSIPSVRGCSYF